MLHFSFFGSTFAEDVKTLVCSWISFSQPLVGRKPRTHFIPASISVFRTVPFSLTMLGLENLSLKRSIFDAPWLSFHRLCKKMTHLGVGNLFELFCIGTEMSNSSNLCGYQVNYLLQIVYHTRINAGRQIRSEYRSSRTSTKMPERRTTTNTNQGLTKTKKINDRTRFITKQLRQRVEGLSIDQSSKASQLKVRN